MLLKFPRQPWKWEWVSANPNITWEFVLTHRDRPWDWNGLSRNPNMTWKIANDYRHEPWNWQYIYMYAKITQADIQHPDFIIDFPDRFFWGLISRNPSITWDVVAANSAKPWDWNYLSVNPNMTWDIVKKHPEVPWHWRSLSRVIKVTWESILEDLASPNPKPWDWHELSYNPSITLDNIRFNINGPDPKDWDMSGVLRKPGITIQMIINNKDEWYNYADYLSRNPGLTFEIVQSVSGYPWRWDELSKNPGVVPDWDFVYNLIKIIPNGGIHAKWDTWHLSNLSANPNTTWRMVLKYIKMGKCNWEELSRNTYHRDSRPGAT